MIFFSKVIHDKIRLVMFILDGENIFYSEFSVMGPKEIRLKVDQPHLSQNILKKQQKHCVFGSLPHSFFNK